MSRVTLSPAGADSFEAIKAYVEQYFAFDGLIYDSKVEAAILELLQEESLGRYFFVRFESETIGYVCVTHGFDAESGGRIGWLTDNFLEEPYRGRGLGAEVMDELKKLATGFRWNALCLVVIDGNSVAERLYTKAGFQRDVGRAYFTLRI